MFSLPSILKKSFPPFIFIHRSLLQIFELCAEENNRAKIMKENNGTFQLLPTLRSLMGEEKAEFQRRQAQNLLGKLALSARAKLSRQEGTK